MLSDTKSGGQGHFPSKLWLQPRQEWRDSEGTANEAKTLTVKTTVSKNFVIGRVLVLLKSSLFGMDFRQSCLQNKCRKLTEYREMQKKLHQFFLFSDISGRFSATIEQAIDRKVIFGKLNIL